MKGWARVAERLIEGGAGLLGHALLPGIGGQAGGAVGSMIADALGVSDDAGQVLDALERDPQALADLRALQIETRAELRRVAMEGEFAALAAANQTARVEAQSEDAYVRRARPTLLYLVGAICTFLAVAGAASVFAGKGSDFAAVAEAMAIPLGTLCAACGIYVRSRSTHDKALAAGHTPPAGLLAQLIGGRR